MTLAPTPLSSFEYLDDPGDDDLLTAAAAIATHATNDPSVGTVVIAVRPEAEDHHVLSGGGSGALRAAVSVAVAAGHRRLWETAPEHDTEEYPVRTLPEVVAAAADGSGITSVHCGAVRHDDELACVVWWFGHHDAVASVEDRRTSLRLLEAAAERSAEHRRAERDQREIDAARVADDAGDPNDGPRTFDPADPDLDPVTGLAHADRFQEALDDHEGEQATLVLIDVDDFDGFRDTHGTDAADGLLRAVADRLLDNCRGTDIVARIDDHRFAILFAETERSIGMKIAKRLSTALSHPFELPAGDVATTATMALAHQVGLLDMDELLESADDAIASGKRSGGGRFVLAA